MKKEILTTTNLNNSKKLSKVTEAMINVILEKPFLLELIVNVTVNKVYKEIEKELKKLQKNFPDLYSAIKTTLKENADTKF